MSEILKGENWVFFDIDGTLVKEAAKHPFTQREIKMIFAIKNGIRPYLRKTNKKGDQFILFWNPYSNEVEAMEILTQHVRLLKHMKGRGRQIMAWSANGYMYAERVISALRILDYVDACMSKPLSCVDDLEPNDFMKRIFLKRGER